MSNRSARPVYTTFDPARGPSGYTATNLMSFINHAGLNEELENAIRDVRANNQAEYSRLLGGLNPSSPNFWTEVSRNQATRRLHVANQQQARFDLLADYVDSLPPGQTLTLPSTAMASSTARYVSGAALQKIYTDDGVDGLVRTLNEVDADRLRTNGLEDMAKTLGVPAALLSKLPDTGDDRRRALVNAILVHLGQPVKYHGVPEGTGRASSSRSPRRATAPTVTRDQALAILEDRKISDALQLLNLTSSELNRLTRELGLIPANNKANTIKRITDHVGWEDLPSKDDVTEKYNRIMNDANITRALAAAKAMRPEELNMLTGAQLVALHRRLNLKEEMGSTRSRPSKAAIIAHLTQGQSRAGPSATASRRALNQIRRDYGACVNADIARVRDVADGLRISYNQFTSKEQLCADIYAYHLGRVSDILISNLDNLEAIAANPETAPGRLAVIARNVNLDIKPNTVEELLQHWIPSHYGSRAIRLAPGQNAIVTAYIRNGTIPANVRQQYALARVFADIRPDLEQLEDDQLADALQDLYDRFIAQAMAGDLATIQNRASSLTGRAAYVPNGSPRRNASPATQSPRRSQLNASPRRNASPAQSAISSLTRNASPRRNASPVQRNASPRMSQLTQSPRRNASPTQRRLDPTVSQLGVSPRRNASPAQRNASPRRNASDFEEFDGPTF